MDYRSLHPLEVYPASTDNNVVTSDTLRLMLPWKVWACSHPPVIAAAREALSALPADSPAYARAAAVHKWMTRRGWACLLAWLGRGQRCLEFVPHEQLLEEMGFEGDEQLLIPPYLFLQFGRGDCPMYAMLTASLLDLAGVPNLYVTLAADSRDPSRWSHVYTVAVLEDGSYLPCDTAAAAQRPELGLGWEATGYRRAEWVM
jgi:hypothetical protein